MSTYNHTWSSMGTWNRTAVTFVTYHWGFPSKYFLYYRLFYSHAIKSAFEQKWHIQQPASLFGVSQWDCDLRESLAYADLTHRIKAEPNQPPPQWQEKLAVSILVRNSSFTDVLPMELYVMLRLSGSWYICYKEVITRLHKQRLP